MKYDVHHLISLATEVVLGREKARINIAETYFLGFKFINETEKPSDLGHTA